MEDVWEPGRWHDTHREALERVIEEKARTGHVTHPPAETGPAAEPLDIMNLLQESLAALGKEAAPARPARARRRVQKEEV